MFPSGVRGGSSSRFRGELDGCDTYTVDSYFARRIFFFCSSFLSRPVLAAVTTMGISDYVRKILAIVDADGRMRGE